MRFNVLVVAVTTLVISASPAHAFTDGSGWQIVAQMTEMIKKANDQLSTMRKSLREFERNNDFLQEIKKANDHRETMYEDITDGELAELVDEMGELSGGLGDIKQSLSKENLNQWIEDIDRELKSTTDGPVKNRLLEYKHALQAIRRLEKAKVSQQNALKALAADPTERQSAQMAARAASMMTLIEVERQKQAAEEAAANAYLQAQEHELMISSGALIKAAAGVSDNDDE